jgi:hypothetical protein
MMGEIGKIRRRSYGFVEGPTSGLAKPIAQPERGMSAQHCLHVVDRFQELCPVPSRKKKSNDMIDQYD